MRARLVLVACVVGLASAGCAGSDRVSTAPLVTDSAGVRVVEHVASEPLPPTLSFELGDEPLVRVGLSATDDSLTLFGVAGGVLLPDGDFLAADGGNFRLVRFSMAGALVAEFGGRGEGPGEFQTILWLQPTSSGLVTYDSRSRRLSWFDPEGGFLKSMPVALERPEPPTDDAIIASGSPFAVVGTSSMLAYPGAHADPDGTAGPLPFYGDFSTYDSTSMKLTDVGRFVVMDWYEDPSLEGFPLANRLEAGRVWWSARDELVAIADAVGHRVDVLEAGGRRTVILERRPRIVFEPDSVPAEYHLAADSLQAYRDVRIDGEHRIWVKPAVAPGTALTGWRAFSVDGEVVGELILPTDATLLDATSDRVLLLRRSDLDEESLEVRNLTSPPR